MPGTVLGSSHTPVENRDSALLSWSAVCSTVTCSGAKAPDYRDRVFLPVALHAWHKVDGLASSVAWIDSRLSAAWWLNTEPERKDRGFDLAWWPESCNEHMYGSLCTAGRYLSRAPGSVPSCRTNPPPFVACPRQPQWRQGKGMEVGESSLAAASRPTRPYCIFLHGIYN